MFGSIPALRTESDTGKPVIVDEIHLTTVEFENAKIAETIATRGDKSCRPFHSSVAG
jgi:hypothetical protein